jgi:hypothetical protein
MIGDFDPGSVVRQLPLPTADALAGTGPVAAPQTVMQPPATAGNVVPVLAARQLPQLGGFLNPATTSLPDVLDQVQTSSNNASTTTPKLNPPPPKAAAATKTQPTIKMSELPEFTLGQLKALSAYLPRQLTPTDNLKIGYQNLVMKQYADTMHDANGNRDLIKKAEDMLRKMSIPTFAPAAASIASVMPGYDD